MLICILIAFGVAPPADSKAIQELIRSLGVDDFAVREDATRRLMRRQDAVAPLQRELLSRDLEARQRAGKILATLRAERSEAVRRRVGRLFRDGRLDLASTLLAEDDGLDRVSGCWLELTRVASQIYDAEVKRGSRQPLRGDFENWLKNLVPLHEGAIEATPPGSHPGITVSSGRTGRGDRLVTVSRRAMFSVEGQSSYRLSLSYSLAINAGGSAVYTTAARSIMICSGDVTLPAGASDCIVVARGRVRINGPLMASTILSHDEVTFSSPRLARPSTLPQHTNVIREHLRGPISGIRFFDLDEFGLVMAKGTDVARAVGPGVFRAAGLRPGDIFVSVGGEKARDAESIRSSSYATFSTLAPSA